MKSPSPRQSTGVPRLDEKIGGGLLPGTMTVLIGSTGIGKTQFGLQYAHAGLKQEGKCGIIFDMAARVDPQGHKEYAERLLNWTLREEESERAVDFEHFWDKSKTIGDYFHALTYKGRRVTKRDLDFDQWNDWQAELSKHLDATIAYFFGHFVQGCRRCVVDGIEPVQHQGESIQFELLEYVYHQIIRKESDWVARDLFRQRFRENEKQIQQHSYRYEDVGCLVNYTTAETLLDAIIEKPLDEGDLLASANTIIYLGKIREGNKFRRAMYVAKHRGSVCPDEILPYDIDDNGLRLL
ncbi:MAG: recombinase RecA [Planctomycetaceae bacterium]|jgi:KaiC/GvpD/RAD55 family RecA-like ATPase|nr:recombinase RecA [Planctomycetaceae bacterium]